MPAGPSSTAVVRRCVATASSTSDSSRASGSSRPTSILLVDRPPIPAAVLMPEQYGPPPGSAAASAVGRGSGALLDRDHLVGDQPVRLAVHPRGGLGVRRLDQAEHLARALVEPVLLVVDPVGALRLEVSLVGTGHRLGGQPLDLLVDIHEQRHVSLLRR